MRSMRERDYASTTCAVLVFAGCMSIAALVVAFAFAWSVFS